MPDDVETRRRWFDDWRTARRKWDRADVTPGNDKLWAEAGDWRRNLRWSHACARCGRPAEDLTWNFVRISKVAGVQAGYGFTGWMTLCEACKLCVDRFGPGEWVA